MTSITDIIIRHLQEEFISARPDFVLTEDTDLLDDTVLDSLGIFVTLSFLEVRWGIQIEPDEVTLDNFRSPRAIAALVESKLDAQEMSA
jgi:acyl carrier protein